MKDPKTPVFKVSDLTTKKVSVRGGLRTGSVGLVGPDQDPDDFPTISPWIMLGKALAQLSFIDRVEVDKIDLQMIDRVALDVGRQVVAGKFFPGTAQCTIDMPTCARNERISPVASLGESITNIDLGQVRDQLRLTIERIDRFEKKFE